MLILDYNCAWIAKFHYRSTPAQCTLFAERALKFGIIQASLHYGPSKKNISNDKSVSSVGTTLHRKTPKKRV